ncbi:MAG TPA: type II secretion system F family protein [Solirubrobacterales bacterium]|nr:type II secretion system F family protein [Solirubrobacterales bacterium]
MTPAGLFFALAFLLALAAGRELLVARAARRAVRNSGQGEVANTAGRASGRAAGASRVGATGGLSRRWARVALWFDLPERLRRSGLEARLPLPALLLGKAAGLCLGAILALGAAPAAPGRIGIAVALGLPAAGFFVPDALLEREARRRRRRLVAALPDALDLLAVSVASGRGPADGLAQLARAGEGPLAEEMRIAVAELSCGSSLSAALAALRARVPGSELATLIASIERSRRFGSPLADQLRRQATALRRDSRRAVEERAARAAPKIQLVVALVLVPSVMLMIAAGLIANAGTLLSGF